MICTVPQVVKRHGAAPTFLRYSVALSNPARNVNVAGTTTAFA